MRQRRSVRVILGVLLTAAMSVSGVGTTAAVDIAAVDAKAVGIERVGADFVDTGAGAADRASARRGPLDLVVLGDSFASGVGNTPYIAKSGKCKRSDDAYGPLLAQLRAIRLQAFVACSGATTTQVSGIGPNGTEAPQIESITRRTDVVTVQALGNDYFVGEIETLCLTGECTPSTTLRNGQTIQQVLDSIPRTGPGLLDALYSAIEDRLDSTGSRARVVVTDYPSLFGDGGGVCSAVMTAGELAIAEQMVTALNGVIKEAARRHHLRYAPVSALFEGHDLCSATPAIYLFTLPGTPGAPAQDPGGALHPNRFGQLLYALAVGRQLLF
ncbi:SGNH/GDSL hydrolase family protein [Nakamurella sp. GG22]